VSDYETDAIIQNSLRTELGKDVTLLTVAHRLASVIDSDKIVCRVLSLLSMIGAD
jgi:ABC-type multidrug transport system fused ATPase/permease subunit